MTQAVTRFARAAGAFVPDAMATAILMLALLFVISLGLGNSVTDIANAFYSGLWMLLPFSMQMALMLLLSGALSVTPQFNRLIQALAQLPRNSFHVVLLATVLTSTLSYAYWALGMALGPLIAVNFSGAAERRGIRIDLPCMLATQFAATSIWQFGISSSAALLVATPGHFLESTTGVMPLSTTIGSAAAIWLCVLFPACLILLSTLIMPRDIEPLSSFPRAQAMLDHVSPATEPHQGATQATSGFAAWCEQSRVLPLILGLALASWLYVHFISKRTSLDLNSMLTLLLLLAVVLHRNIAALLFALSRSISSCWQIMVLYQLYGAVAGVLQYTNTGSVFGEYFARIATPMSFTFLTALAGTLVAIFVPSSGGQWIIQGLVTTKAAAAVGASPQQGLLALGIGDQMGNLVSPFWMVVVASIGGIDFRKIFGYTLVFGVLWFVLAVALFTAFPAH